VNESCAIAMVLLGACSPEPSSVRWRPIDLEALDEALAAPTADVTPRTTREVAAAFAREEVLLGLTIGFVRRVLTREEGREVSTSTWRRGSAVPRVLEDEALSATSVYVRASCPGPDPSNPDVDFAYGQLRIDSAQLTREALEDYTIEGDLFLQFEACRMSSLELDGTMAAYYDPDAIELALAPDLQVEDRVTGSWPSSGFERPMRVTDFEAAEVLFVLESARTLVLEWTTAGTTVGLRGRNGAFACAFDREPPALTCEGP
jgi:hypothetical protein